MNDQSKPPAKSSTAELTTLSQPVSERDHAQGEPTAAVTLTMYGAYECPHCVEANKIIKELQRRLGARLRFVFRHFPLINVHPHAEAAAEVAEAAGAEGKFWEMHDTLFAHFNQLDGEHLVHYAEDMGLDMRRFDEAMSKRLYSPRVQADVKSGTESGVHGTPTFFINGVRHQGSWQTDELLEAIEHV